MSFKSLHTLTQKLHIYKLENYRFIEEFGSCIGFRDFRARKYQFQGEEEGIEISHKSIMKVDLKIENAWLV